MRNTPQRTARGTRKGFQVETSRPPIGTFPIFQLIGFRLFPPEVGLSSFNTLRRL